MDCAADLDFYRFTPPNDGAFTFTGVGGAAVYLTLLDSSGVQLNGAPGSMTMSLVSGNVYIPKSQVLGYFSEEDIKQTKTINGKTYANLDTLKSENGVSVIITNDKIKFLKMCDMVP
jgi:hypothetical protein